MLTKKQLDLLTYIYCEIREKGISPSFDEMRLALDVRSKAGIHRLILSLEEKGFLKRLPNRARAVEIIKLPDSFPRPLSAFTEITPPEHFTLHAQPDPAHLLNCVRIPIMGRIAAGVPISAIEDFSQNILVPIGLVGEGTHFALEVHGDSMLNAGILDGDTIFLKKVDTARNGDIIVALIDNEEATLKRLRGRTGYVMLESANPAYETRTYDSHRIRIQGVLVGLMRKY